MPDLEALGDAATGAVVARTVEPKAGEGDGHTDERACLNCGCALTGDYCHCCGQRAHVHRTLSAFWHDLLHGALHFEGKIWRTLPLLARKPGELTRRYVNGERAKFVSPIALFLFSVFMMFAVFGTLGGPFSIQVDRAVMAEAAAEMEAEAADRRRTIADLRAERARLAAAGQPTQALDRSIASLESELRVLAATSGVARGGDSAGGSGDGFREVFQKVATGETDLPPPVEAALHKAAETNPSLLLYKVQANAYKFSWLLIPISTPFLWLLLFWKRQFKLYDHAVFVTYSLAFMTLGLIALSLLRPLGLNGGLAFLAIAVVPPLHMYRQLRGAYSLSRFGAIWRTILLMAFAIAAGTLFFMLLLTVGVLS